MTIDHKTKRTFVTYPTGETYVYFGSHRPNRLKQRKPAFTMGFRGLPRVQFKFDD